MLTREDVTWNEDGFKNVKPESIIFESICPAIMPMFVIDNCKERQVISLKYYTVNFARKSFVVCLAQFITDFGGIEQVIINGTGHENLDIDGVEYSELIMKEVIKCNESIQK